jgi:hypothetical protein
MKTILKFDTGADGFMKMIMVLAVTSVLVLILGGYFLLFIFPKDTGAF